MSEKTEEGGDEWWDPGYILKVEDFLLLQDLLI